MNRTFTSIAGATGVLLFVASTILSGLQLENYSHVSQLISESYASGTPRGPALRFAGFLPAGLLLAFFAFSSKKLLRGSRVVNLGLIAVGIFYGLGTAVVSLFPCDAGCNPEMINPSISQLIHNLSGMLTYLVVPPALVITGFGLLKQPEHRIPAQAAIAGGILSFLLVMALPAAMAAGYGGLVQRLAEGCILIWFLITAHHIFYAQN